MNQDPKSLLQSLMNLCLIIPKCKYEGERKKERGKKRQRKKGRLNFFIQAHTTQWEKKRQAKSDQHNYKRTKKTNKQKKQKTKQKTKQNKTKQKKEHTTQHNTTHFPPLRLSEKAQLLKQPLFSQLLGVANLEDFGDVRLLYNHGLGAGVDHVVLGFYTLKEKDEA